MKISDSFRFPYPVLNETYSDYSADSIDIEVEISEPKGTGPTDISFKIILNSEAIQSSISKGGAKVFLSVVCQDTFYSHFFPLDSLSGSVCVAEGELFGTVSVRAVVAVVSTGILEAIGASPEYSSTKFEVQAGAVLAWTGPRDFQAGFEKLAPMASIFEIAEDRNIPEDTFDVDPNNDHITILLSPKLLRTVSTLRNTNSGKSLLLNSVYLPAVMDVIAHIRTGNFESKRWCQIFRARSVVLGINLQSTSPLKLAQAFLKAPSSRLHPLTERM